jgi:glucose/arabinose dehydrogenase
MLKRLLISSLIPATTLLAQNPVTILLENFATGLIAPVDIAHCGDERLFIVEQAGRIMIVNPDGSVNPTPFLDIQTRVNDGGGEQGLLGLAFDPEYASNGRFYVNYTAGSGNGSTRVSRFRVTEEPNVADPDSEEILYTVVQPASNHNAGDLDFGPDGYLYIPLGDGGSGNDPWNNGQDLVASALGDIVRLDVSGETGYTVPESNPWVNAGNDTLPEIWASGLRNPFRFGFDALTGDLWIGDVGQNQREEVDFWPAGDNSGPNFGWRCYEGNIATPGINDDCPAASEFVGPVTDHTHGDGWCSVIGGRVYRGTEFPRLYGRYFYTDYCPTPYFSLRPDGAGGWIREQARPNNGGTGTSCIAENSALELFVANVNNGTIKRIVDQCPMPAPDITLNGFEITSTEADTYTWFLDGVEIPGAETQTITAQAAGDYYVVGTFGTCSLISDTVQVVGTAVASLGAEDLKVIPVPARDRITLQGVPAGTQLVELVDLTGRVVLSRSWNGSGQGVIELGQLESAAYVLRLTDATGAVIAQRNIQVQH